MIKILSIDGGGIRGIIPALVLEEIERRAGRPISSLFDLIAGSSTGGLLALGLVKPGSGGAPALSASACVKLYEDESAHIFARTNWQRFNAIGNLRKNKYPDDGLNDVLEKFLGNAPMSEALTDVLVTGYEIRRQEPWFFRSSKARQTYDCEFTLKDVARATVAAPTFFPPAEIAPEDSELTYTFIDGSVMANNPALCAYVEARRNYPAEDEFLIVSLGTGSYVSPIPYEQAREWGLIGWSQRMVSIVMHAASVMTDYQLKRLMPRSTDGRRPYYRLQVGLDDTYGDFDDVSQENISALRKLALRLIGENSALLDEIVGRLSLMFPEKKVAAPPGPKSRLASIWQGITARRNGGQ